MKTPLFRFTLYAIIVYLTGATLNPAIASFQPGNGTHFCGVIDGQPRFHRDSRQSDKQHSDQFPNRHYVRSFAANLNVGEPRTVRMIYFLPNDRPYRADVVQRMKDGILGIQAFYAEAMQAEGYGKVTFRFETDPQGEPIVHRVNGQHPDSHYLDTTDPIFDKIEQAFDLHANIYLIVIDNSTDRIDKSTSGIGGRQGKNAGFALITGGGHFLKLAAHELGHAFGLEHNFRDDMYIMSYGPGWDRLSSCSAEFLSMHPYFNPDTPIEEGPPPTIELISPRTYPAGAQSVSVQLKVSDSEGLHQVLLFAFGNLQACRGLAGKRDTVVEFDYDGVFTREGFMNFSSAAIHPIDVKVVDTDGNVSREYFALAEISPYHIGTLAGHTDRVNSLSFSHDGVLASGAWDGTTKLWDVATQRDIGTLLGHVGQVSSVSFSHDGTILASGSPDRTVTLWDVETQQDIGTLLHENPVASLSFSRDGVLASGAWDGTVTLWDVKTQQDIGTLARHTDLVSSVSFSRDGVLASGAWDGTVTLWDVKTQQDIGTLLGHVGQVTSVSFSHDGAILASGSYGMVKLWNVETQQDIGTLPHTHVVESVSFSRDGTTLASGSDDNTVKLWDITTRISFATFSHTDSVSSVLFSPDGRTLASGTRAGPVELWAVSELTRSPLETLVEISIPDPNFRAAIETALGKAPREPIFRGNMTTLTKLFLSGASISDLTGLEFAANLEYLDVSNNDITDVSVFTPVLSNLTGLTTLVLSDNSVSDISPVTGLINLTHLWIDSNRITDASALSSLTNLTGLNLSDNSISDISPVASLTNLTRLFLADNRITDVSTLSDLTNLRELILSSNRITDVSVLSSLTNLTMLWISLNHITDVSVLSSLTNLKNLNFGSNSISDISGVAGLTHLTHLYLDYNLVSDISPLVANTGLGGGDEIYMTENPLSYQSIHTHIPILRSRGVTVEFDDQPHPALLKISGDNQKRASFTSLSQPFVVEAQDANGSALTGVSVTFAVTAGGGTLSTTITRTNENGRAQSTLTLGPNLGTNTVEVSAAGIKSPVTFYAISDTEVSPITADVNNDGSVNILDLILIASSFGQSGQNNADVNRDGVVSILDLVLVAGMFDNAAAAPAAQPQVPETLTAVEVQGWLTDARALTVKAPIMKRGFAVLEQLLVSLTPTETELLENYPNPFNPETWIPYRLAEDAFVTLTIYDGSGHVVRTLEVGHRIASAYESRSKAIHWDGRNNVGEQVASGVYFYALTAADYSATRKMVILK